MKGNEFSPYLLGEKTMAKTIMETIKLNRQRKFFGDFIFENQFGIFFSRTNVGKSTLAVQICEMVASGNGDYINLETIKGGTKVVFIDLETSDYSLNKKYVDKDTKEIYNFSKNFYRYSYKDYEFFCNGYDYELNSKDSAIKFIEMTIEITGAKFVILDNISVFSDVEQTNAKEATKLILELRKLKSNYDITFLIVAHTTKIMPFEGITINDMAGSAQLQNLIDFSFSMGKSGKDPENLRYLIQLKQRDGNPEKYGSRNVLVCRYDKSPYPHLNFERFENEEEHRILLKQWESDIVQIIMDSSENLKPIQIYDKLILLNKKEYTGKWKNSDSFRVVMNRFAKSKKAANLISKNNSGGYFYIGEMK
jgi:hypothetical protein